MAKILSGMEPQAFFDHFEEISAIPRGSYHEKQISDFLKEFAVSRGMEVTQDEYYNLLIKKKASLGYENSAPIIFHGHMDMVLDKEPWVEQNMLTEGIRLKVDGDWIKADGTTLGADNGVGVAYMMCILENDQLQHPPIECMITVQEEVGKRGGTVFDPKDIKGKRLMDFNWHKPDTIFAGCAGDISAYLNIPVIYENVNDNMVGLKMSLTGGIGGHSEFDIHLERMNAICSFARVLERIGNECEIHINEMSAGVNRYVIPGSMESVIVIKKEDTEKVQNIVDEMNVELKNEYRISDPKISLFMTETGLPAKSVTYKDSMKVIKAICLIPCGVQSMSLDIKGLVESSNTVAMISSKENMVSILSTIPSAVTSRRYNILNKIRDIASLIGAEVTTFADCPEWPYKPDSELLEIAKKAYRKLFDEDAKVEVSHSSLELGLFNKKIPGIEMISLGPVAKDVHTPNEKLKWTTVEPVWKWIVEILKDLK